MRALGSEGSPSARVRILSTVKCRLGFLTQGNGFLAGGLSDRRYPRKISPLAHKFVYSQYGINKKI
ncbi:hypothetical protein E2C01_093990 [Portunus trituberculatus]|uniref:Uncharacterized protein n=1 Tax=Portunus trituberculatus TaxID=210409 RepID=A0A5B7JWD4_PORTR|nr:hypothetical protein [Portunus trituberculatus]